MAVYVDEREPPEVIAKLRQLGLNVIETRLTFRRVIDPYEPPPLWGEGKRRPYRQRREEKRA